MARDHGGRVRPRDQGRQSQKRRFSSESGGVHRGSASGHSRYGQKHPGRGAAVANEPGSFRLFGQLETLGILFYASYHTDQSVRSNFNRQQLQIEETTKLKMKTELQLSKNVTLNKPHEKRQGMKVRTVVTGHDAKGRAVFVRDEQVDGMPIPGLGELAFLWNRSEEHTSELQSQSNLVCRLLLEKKK